MLKIALSALVAAGLVAGMGVETADAKAKHKMAKHKMMKKKEMTAAGCSASTSMRDESRFSSCFPMQQQAPKKK